MSKYKLSTYIVSQYGERLNHSEYFKTKSEAVAELRRLKKIVKEDWHNGRIVDWGATNCFNKAVDYRPCISLKYSSGNMTRIVKLEEV